MAAFVPGGACGYRRSDTVFHAAEQMLPAQAHPCLVQIQGVCSLRHPLDLLRTPYLVQIWTQSMDGNRGGRGLKSLGSAGPPYLVKICTTMKKQWISLLKSAQLLGEVRSLDRSDRRQGCLFAGDGIYIT